MYFKSSWVIAILLGQQLAIASTDEEAQLGFSMNEDAHSIPTGLVLKPEERYLRAQEVLKYFGIPNEVDAAPELAPLQDYAQVSEFKNLLPYFDPQSQWGRFFSINSQKLQAFADQDRKTRLDFEVSFKTPSSPKRYLGSYDRIKTASLLNSPLSPLSGLRIALDPGHMGSDFWDNKTGKWVKNSKGRKLSEGLIALQTALLLEKQLQDLGAQVLVTRRTLEAVTPLDFSNLDLNEYGKEALREQTLQNWFQNLLLKFAVGPDLFDAFEDSPNLRALFAESARNNYFILKADLNARVQKIQAFNPDLTLILHYDTSPVGGNEHLVNPTDYNKTKAYVAGGYGPEDFATLENRQLLAAHLLDQEGWDSSLLLSRSILKKIKDQLKVDYDPQSPGSNVVAVEPGIYSRNLILSRKLWGHPVTYLETLYYNAQSEFNALSKAKYSMKIDGQSYPYSERLVQISQALRDGVKDFVSSYH